MEVIKFEKQSGCVNEDHATRIARDLLQISALDVDESRTNARSMPTSKGV